MTGRAARTHTRYGGTSSIAADSGPAIAMFFGTISPSSTCSTTTIVIAMTNETVCSTVSGIPSKWNGISSRCATAGSPTRPNRIEQTVMPSCAPASISGRFSPARITVTALCLPCSARASSRSRRAEINANSAPTKNALAASSTAVSSTPRKSPISVVGSFGALTQLRELQLIDPSTVHLQYGGQPAHRVLQRSVWIERRQFDRLALFRNVAELLQHEAADGLVFALQGPESGRLGHLVDAQQTRHVPALPRLHHVGGGLVVFVADVADDLLDDILDRHHARCTPVFVDHERGLQAVGAQLCHHVVAVQGRWHPGDGLREAGEPGLFVFAWRHFEDLFDVDDPDGFVEVALDDRESRITALDRGVHQIGDRVLDLEGDDFRPGRHQFLGSPRAELQRAVNQRRGDRI